jgi:hypothetical protein
MPEKTIKFYLVAIKYAPMMNIVGERYYITNRFLGTMANTIKDYLMYT